MGTTAAAVTHLVEPSGRNAARRFGQRWLDLPVRRKGFLVIALPVSALVVVVAMSLVLLIQERQARTESTQARNFSTATENTLNLTVNAETGVRGYAAGRLVVLLQPYTQAVASLPATLSQLSRAGAVVRAGPDVTTVRASVTEAFQSFA
jgi:CHASE3 domain